MASSDIFNQVRSAVDIVDVIGEHVALKRAGREFKGLCPFHEDHRPSMAVVPHKQIFHCFVCGTGGDVFKFVKEFHKMSAGEALRMLAQRAGIKLPEWKSEDGKSEGPNIREQIAQTNEWACSYFEKQLRTPQGKAGLDYLHSRGLTDETIAKFRLGFAPEGWTHLVNAALKSQHSALSTQHLLDAGLTKTRSDGSPYDVFRNRVIFPIIDSAGGGSGGRIIAFGGRILEEKRDENGDILEAKYLNSPETKLFIKSESLYGLNLARQHIIRTRNAVVVEGYMDVIACHQAGVHNVIATLGTALTPEHARSLKNYAQTITLVFDSDDAGRRAADRAMEIFVRGTLDIKLTNVPDGKDPCDFCIKHGTGEPFLDLINHATDALTYKWQRLQQDFHATDSLSAKQESVTQFLRFVAASLQHDSQIDPVRRGLLLSKIAGLVALPVPEVQSLLTKLARTNPSPTHNQPQAPDSHQGLSDSTPAQDSGFKTQDSLDLAEAWLLGALLTHPPAYGKIRDRLCLDLFHRHRPLAILLIEYFDHHDDLAVCNLADITTFLDAQDLIRQAIELEAKISNWLDPSNLSPDNLKMVQQLSKDRGSCLDSLLLDSLQQLQSARIPPTDPPPPAPTLDVDLAWLQQIQQRNQQGGNRRFVG